MMPVTTGGKFNRLPRNSHRATSKGCLVVAIIALFGSSPSIVSGELDERALNVNVINAFPELDWPERLTGADTGRFQPPRPLVITGAGDGTNRLFVLSEYGTIHSFANESDVDQMDLFLDIRDRVQFDPKQNEEGLLGLAFHPRFSENGEFFVYYTALATDDAPHASVVARFRTQPDYPSRADPASEEIILRIGQPFWNHNGGTILFGPDGYLYIALGDGGKGGDPFGNGQNLKTLLGAILRIDVDTEQTKRPYGIPSDNPFAGRTDGTREEIWAYGLRNVWRFSFDRELRTCWAADVGQKLYEEINIVVSGGNYGWNIREGFHPFQQPDGEARTKLIDPIWEYDHEVGKSITGGCVYRGSRVPELQGAYLYADYVTGKMWGLWYDHETQQVTANRPILGGGTTVTTFGEDDDGEVYFVTENGGIYRFSSDESDE